jgi:hypothetical protein
MTFSFRRYLWTVVFLFPVMLVPFIVVQVLAQLVAPTPVLQPTAIVPTVMSSDRVMLASVLIGGVLSLFASWRAWRAEVAARASDATAAQTHLAIDQTHTVITAVAAQTSVIESQGNSKAASDKAEIKALQEKLEMVLEMLAKSERRALDLAEKATRMQPIPDQIARIDEATTTVAKVISEALHATPESKG